jgi:D-amino-acid dehydrogenase
MKQQKEQPLVVIGAGIVGLFTAYYLIKSGRRVMVIDRTNAKEGCSFGNAGMVVPSHFIPLASPGMLEKGLRWMLDSESPFYVKPRFSLSLLKWGLNFYKSANAQKVEQAIPALRDLSLLSKKEYQNLQKSKLFDFSFEEKGLLMYCKTEKALEEEIEVANLANKIGITAKELSLSEVQTFEPNLRPNVSGAVFYEGDAHLNPTLLMSNLKNFLTNQGVDFYFDSEVIDFQKNDHTLSAILVQKASKRVVIPISGLVVAAGSWTPNLARKLGLYVPIEAGKGYSVTIKQLLGREIRIPSIFVEARVAITPFMDNTVRFGGTMEMTGVNTKINHRRVNGILKAIPEYYPNYPIPDAQNIWHGLRPCSPDGLPYVGRSARFNNLYFNSGHAMMGVSLASGSGKILSDIINGLPPSIDMRAFKAERF